MMEKTVYLTSAYLAPVSYYAKLFAADKAYIERYDNYVKQTYRNRCVIAAADGPLALTIPTEKSDSLKCPMKDIRISDHGNWRHMHWNALVSNYRNSAFFEYYADDFAHFYEEKDGFLMDFNLRLHGMVSELLGLERGVEFLSARDVDAAAVSDLRNIAEPKVLASMQGVSELPYYQVFAQRNGFIPSLSIVDLLFNTGPEGLLLLRDSAVAGERG